jgi:hypothetical protein
MVSSEVQRTLVKSPPELWAEISDPESLARHLGEFGEIRITRVHPEQRVEWESDDAHGTVAIKPSGWGTKVKLTVTRELPRADETPADADVPDEAEPTPPLADAASSPVAEATAASESTPDGSEFASVADVEQELDSDGQLDADVQPQAEVEPELVADAQPEKPEPASQPRRGFFARLFGRRRPSPSAPHELADELNDSEPTIEDEPPMPAAGETFAGAATETVQAIDGPPAELASERMAAPDAPVELTSDARPEASEREASEPEPVAAEDDPAKNAGEQSTVDIAAEIRAAEEVAAEQVTAVLTGVLDRLGAAHHRPFSRS